MTTLVFTLGPVQDFIAQSRRTADGWVGSFLLSYLSCQAALELERHGEVIDPHLPGIPLYEALRKGSAGAHDAERVTVAGCPNNIVVALKDGARPREAGEAARAVIDAAWHAIESGVWDELPAEARHENTAKLWRRQTADAWETYWAWGADSTAAFDALNARKGLRDFAQIEERGERCTLCAEREALWDRVERTPRLRENVRDYWKRWAVFLRGLGASRSVIKDDGSERLCAVCVVKRLVPWRDNPVRSLWGRRDVVFPSTSTMAARRAKAALVTAAYGGEGDAELRRALEGFVEAVEKHDRLRRHADDPQRVRALRDALAVVRDSAQRNTAERFLKLDGDCLLYGPSVQREQQIDAPTHETIRKAHRRLLNAVPKDRPDAVPSIYWALLAMDGDHMGRTLRALSAHGAAPRAKEASALLNGFAQHVPEVVEQRDGRLIYAGGDDVLALLPVDTALRAAEELRRDFGRRFSEWFDQLPANEKDGLAAPTLSGALVYAHHQTPLGRVVERAQHLLKHAAKNRAGRNAVAVEVRTRAGGTIGFAERWESGAAAPLAERLKEVVAALGGRQVASRFLYELHGFADLMGQDGTLKEADDRLAFVTSLAKKTRLAEAEAEAATIAARLLALSEVQRVDERGAPVSVLDTSPLIFARFLSTGGREAR